MNSAQSIVAKFGGQAELARRLGKAQSTVQYWTKTGTVPAKWHAPLLALAAEAGIELLASDFIDAPKDAPPPSEKRLPEAKWPGDLPIGDMSLQVYVLDDGRRVISRTGAVAALIGPQGGGNLDSYIRVQALAPYVPANWNDQMVEFAIPGVVNRTVLGMTSDGFLDICRAYARARDEGKLSSERQVDIAIKANAFLAACANVGLTALIDEVTGYQYERAEDALQVKLRLYLEEEMRKWERTFPDELWKEFGRLTNWKGPLHERPRYWGRLVMELIYEYLDPDVAGWLKKNAPKPQHGQNYHQWLTSQYGLRRLIEHIWMVIGMASACSSLPELKRKMAEKYGRVPIQMTLYLSPETPTPSLHRTAKRRPSPGQLMAESNADESLI